MSWQRVAALALLIGGAVAAAEFHNDLIAATLAGAAAGFAVNRDSNGGGALSSGNNCRWLDGKIDSCTPDRMNEPSPSVGSLQGPPPPRAQSSQFPEKPFRSQLTPITQGEPPCPKTSHRESSIRQAFSISNLGTPTAAGDATKTDNTTVPLASRRRGRPGAQLPRRPRRSRPPGRSRHAQLLHQPERPERAVQQSGPDETGGRPVPGRLHAARPPRSSRPSPPWSTSTPAPPRSTCASPRPPTSSTVASSPRSPRSPRAPSS